MEGIRERSWAFERIQDTFLTRRRQNGEEEIRKRREGHSEEMDSLLTRGRLNGAEVIRDKENGLLKECLLFTAMRKTKRNKRDQ